MPEAHYTFRWKGDEILKPHTSRRRTVVRGRWMFTRYIYDDNVLVRVIQGDARAMRRLLNDSPAKPVVKRKKVGPKALKKRKK